MRHFEIYYHIAIMDSWKLSHDIIKSHFDSSNILDYCYKINYCINGDISQALDYLNVPADSKHVVHHLLPNVSQYEFPTINLLRQQCINEELDVLYIHTKGASRRLNDRNAHNNHLDIMCYNCISNFQNFKSALDEGYDTAGTLFNDKPFVHYSGNFWWAKSEHVRKLIPLRYGIRNFNDREHPDRHDAEKWLCSVPGNFFNLRLINKKSINY